MHKLYHIYEEISRTDELEAARLQDPFSVEKIRAALSDLNGDKTIRSGWVHTAIWQHNLETVKEEVLIMFRKFHENGKFVRSLNTTFLVLVPKREGDKDRKDYTPISMVGSLYKWIAKVLANSYDWELKMEEFIAAVHNRKISPLEMDKLV